ncbi:MAG TPA: protein translocase subunit SecD [Anaerolineales bacterium]|nr:protein translocase subunit SecD [Anaerolineales bacterium]HMV97837.1 protein translocase subunit SecD [Anaerolineales bacterium]HMX19595.1 protein translocase subunit SecD [Anaerolineales bacterium]HMX74477.1 protein translocase subunit SecD [Anaerolineales bacterium]HMZ42921.1 protein translocase subunit SecD [Anaerolineales bacterium]
MRNRNSWLIITLLLVAFSLWIDLSKDIVVYNPFNNTPLVERNVDVKLGLDLRGGLQALLEADVPAETTVSAEELQNATNILQNRANALGVSEITMVTAGERRIVAEFPGLTNPEEMVAALKQTALLEFVDMGSAPVPDGTTILTDFGLETPGQTTNENGETIYHTVMTGAGLDSAVVQRDPSSGQIAIAFTLDSDAADVFSEYTSSHVGQYLAIVLDKRVISAPRINQAITDGQGQISGGFTQESAQTLAVQLRSGALPIPIKVVQSRTIGATLGEESIRRSVQAGIIGMIVVILFMAFNYRLPGVIADLALVCYTLFSLMLFKLIPVTLTLPGIAGFILSLGMAVDANVLIFERLKEELRSGRNLRQAIDLAWSRAWPSIRDSNTSTLITCAILFIFGNTFGASIVKGFSVTLSLGVVVSLFTAIIVTRTFLHSVLDSVKTTEHPRWFGL